MLYLGLIEAKHFVDWAISGNPKMQLTLKGTAQKVINESLNSKIMEEIKFYFYMLKDRVIDAMPLE